MEEDWRYPISEEDEENMKFEKKKLVPSIDAQGLIPKGRLYVHLSKDTETAIKRFNDQT